MVTERAQIIKKASWVGIIGNAVLALLKVSTGLYTGSLSVIGDGVDSTADILMSLVSLFSAIIIAKPPDKNHPYGHFRAETMATLIISLMMFIVGLELFRGSITGLLHPEPKEIPSVIALYVMGVSIAGKVLLSQYLCRAGKKIDSSILIASGRNMRNDVLISSGVLIGLIFVIFLNLPFIDYVIAVVISAWIMFTAVRIFWDINREFMDSVEDQSVYDCIFKAVGDSRGAVNPHRTRVRKLSSLLMIDLDIEVDGNMTVTEAHSIAMEVERTIKKQLPNVYDIMVHVEPRGNIEEKEKFGMSGTDIDEK